jgi:plastocyanin
MTKFIALALAVTAAGAAACAGGSSSGSTAAPTPGAPASSTATITLTSSGASPKTVTISAGGQVTFINSDSRTHNMQSDPHPEHTDCPELAQVGFLTPGQSRTSGNLNIVRTCGYHDHDDFSNTRFQGNIVIQ